MKAALVQVTTPSAAGNFDLTDANITSDFKGAIIFGAQTTANMGVAQHAQYYVGACDAAGNQGGIALSGKDAAAIASANAGSNALSTGVGFQFTPNAGTQCTYAYNSTLTNGVRLAVSGASINARLMNALLLSGSDLAFAVSNLHLTSAQTVATVPHGLGITPECVMVLHGGTNLNSPAAGTGVGVGFWDGTTSVGSGYNITNFPAVSSAVGAQCGSSDIGAGVTQTPSVGWNWTLSAVGSTNLTLTRSSAGGVNTNVIVVAWGKLANNSAAKAYVDQTRTTTGNNTPVTGLSVAPLFWLNVSTRLASTSFASDDTAGSWGFAAGANNAGTIQQGAMCTSYQQGLSTTVAKNWSSYTRASMTLVNTGASVATASIVQSFNSDGFTENVQTAGGTAWERINLVYGISSGAYPGVWLGTGSAQIVTPSHLFGRMQRTAFALRRRFARDWRSGLLLPAEV